MKRISEPFGPINPKLKQAHESFDRPSAVKKIHTAESGAVKTVFTDNTHAQRYVHHMAKHGFTADKQRKQMGDNAPEFHVLINPNIQKDEAEVAQKVVDDVLDPDFKAQVNPDEIPATSQAVMNKSYTPEETACMVLKKAQEMLNDFLQKARIDESRPISQKIEMRTDRNERVAKEVKAPHPKDNRIGTDEIQTNFVGHPKQNSPKTQKLRDFVEKMALKRKNNNL